MGGQREAVELEGWGSWVIALIIASTSWMI